MRFAKDKRPPVVTPPHSPGRPFRGPHCRGEKMEKPRCPREGQLCQERNKGSGASLEEAVVGCQLLVVSWDSY